MKTIIETARLTLRTWKEKDAEAYGFKKRGLKEIISFTVPENIRSIRVMEKIGLRRDLQGDFAHPKLPSDHRLSHHILYLLP